MNHPIITSECPSIEGLSAADITIVHDALRDAAERRAERLLRARALSHHAFARDLTALRYDIDRQAMEPIARRSSAFTPLRDLDLGLLDRQLDEDQDAGRIEVLSNIEPVQNYLAILRVNQVVGAPILSPLGFRTVGLAMLHAAAPHVVAFLTPYRITGKSDLPMGDLVAVLPWRAALLAGEVYRALGVEHVWHIGASRDEATLQPSFYYERAAPEHTRSWVHLVIDPMLATGGTTSATIEALLARGVIQDNIIVHTVIAAPEGVDFLLRVYPRIRIVTCALDAQLDHRGYIIGTGLGDFGDLAFDDVDSAYADARWVKPGLLTADEAERVIARTHAIRTHAATAHAPSPTLTAP